MPQSPEGYSRIERLFALRRKRYNEGLSEGEQAELAELNAWARDGYGINDPEEPAAPAEATAAAPAEPGFAPSTEYRPR